MIGRKKRAVLPPGGFIYPIMTISSVSVVEGFATFNVHVVCPALHFGQGQEGILTLDGISGPMDGQATPSSPAVASIKLNISGFTTR
jgi:hypothetical protein